MLMSKHLYRICLYYSDFLNICRSVIMVENQESIKTLVTIFLIVSKIIRNALIPRAGKKDSKIYPSTMRVLREISLGTR